VRGARDEVVDGRWLIVDSQKAETRTKTERQRKRQRKRQKNKKGEEGIWQGQHY
jgi:hypothetical protein